MESLGISRYTLNCSESCYFFWGWKTVRNLYAKLNPHQNWFKDVQRGLLENKLPHTTMVCHQLLHLNAQKALKTLKTTETNKTI